MTKYVGKIYDGRWKVCRDNKNNSYYLLNIFNKEIMPISWAKLAAIDSGKITVNYIRKHRAFCSHESFVKRMEARIEYYGGK